MSSEPPAIAATALAKWYGTRDAPVHALAETELAIAPGEFLVLLGPSGCGKTTLLRMIGGLLAPTSGSLSVMGAPLWQGSRRNDAALNELGMVFQDANLFPWMTIEQNIALPLELRGVGRAERAARARELMRMVGLAGFERRWPRELSGGMRQRAAIARALARDPDILLMDEPFGALDAMTREAMNLELQRIWMATRKTVVLVTHSIAEAVFLADRILLLSPRPGRLDREVLVPFARPRAPDVQAHAAFQEIAVGLRHRLAEFA